MRGERGVLFVDPLRVLEIGELLLPVVTLRVQFAREIQQRRIAVAIVKPQHG